MKILYAIQGTGNGHLTVALEVLPLLMKKADVDILISGTEVEVSFPYEIKYRLNGLCFVFGKKGGIDYLETFKKAKLKTFYHEIKQLPVDDYDLVISDFEPVSAWACYLKGKPCIGFSHQAAVINKAAPKPKKGDLIGQAVLKYYAPVSANYGFHFVPYDTNIFTPIIRRAIREAIVSNEGHYTVYLPTYSDRRVIKLLSLFPKCKWEVFSKRCTQPYTHKNIAFFPINGNTFVRSMVAAAGVVCGAGFQTPSEALFLKKKLVVVPMKGQYEQQCNAVALQLLGIPVLRNIKTKHYKKLKAWLETDATLLMDFPNETEWILNEILAHAAARPSVRKLPNKDLSTSSRFRDFVVKKIFYQTGV